MHAASLASPSIPTRIRRSRRRRLALRLALIAGLIAALVLVAVAR